MKPILTYMGPKSIKQGTILLICCIGFVIADAFGIAPSGWLRVVADLVCMLMAVSFVLTLLDYETVLYYAKKGAEELMK